MPGRPGMNSARGYRARACRLRRPPITCGACTPTRTSLADRPWGLSRSPPRYCATPRRVVVGRHQADSPSALRDAPGRRLAANEDVEAALMRRDAEADVRAGGAGTELDQRAQHADAPEAEPGADQGVGREEARQALRPPVAAIRHVDHQVVPVGP